MRLYTSIICPSLIFSCASHLACLLYTSNGPVEGKNNYIKKILSNANGMTNFQRARNRILYSQNKYETYSMNEHRNKIKRTGNPRGAYKKTKIVKTYKDVYKRQQQN